MNEILLFYLVYGLTAITILLAGCLMIMYLALKLTEVILKAYPPILPVRIGDKK